MGDEPKLVWHRMTNKTNHLPPQVVDFTEENRVHIAGGYGAEIEGNSNDFNARTRNPRSALGVKCTVEGRSSPAERSVHIGNVGGSIPSAPTVQPASRRFKSMTEAGFPEYFWSKVAVGAPSHCWPWKLSHNRDGYGQIKVGGAYWTASRLAHVLATGDDLKGQLVCHHCDNPSCCNPSHLYAGSKSDNERDKVARGRHNPTKGEKNHFAKLTAEKVEHIRHLFAQGKSNTAIGQLLGVHHSTISKIRTGASW